MEHQAPAKRSWFTPIVLLMLVMSVMGNVVLYTHKLQSDQRERVLAGEHIIKSAWQAKYYIETVLEQTDRLLGSNETAARISAKQTLGSAYSSSQGMADYIAQARSIQPRESTEGEVDPLIYLSQVELSLRNIAVHDMELAVSEREYLTGVQSIYSRLLEQISTFDTTQTTQQNALQILIDSKWIDAAYAMLSIISEHENVLYEGVNP